MLLIVSNVCAFGGRMLRLALSQASQPSTGAHRPALFVALSLLGASLAGLYWRASTPRTILSVPPSEVWPVLLYSTTAAVNGYTTVWIAETAQSSCGHSLAMPCPITMQFIWLSLQVGAFATSIACATFVL